MRAKADKGNTEEAEANKSRPDKTKDNKAMLHKKRDNKVIRTHLFEGGRVGIGGG